MVLRGLTRAYLGETFKVVVEQPYRSAATVTPSPVCLPSSGSSNRIPVELTNNPPQPIILSLQFASEFYKDSAQSEDGEGLSIDLSATNLTPEQAEQVKEILAQMSCVFSKESTPLRSTMRCD